MRNFNLFEVVDRGSETQGLIFTTTPSDNKTWGDQMVKHSCFVV